MLWLLLKFQALQRQRVNKINQSFWKGLVITFFFNVLSSAPSHFCKLVQHSYFQLSKSQSFFCLRETVNTYCNKAEWRLLNDVRQSCSPGLHVLLAGTAGTGFPHGSRALLLKYLEAPFQTASSFT